MSPPTFRELFAKYPTDKDTDHSYGEVYDELFAPLRHRLGALLEMGIAQGGSLRAWEEYFPQGRIYGVDIFENSHLNTARIRAFQADLRVGYEVAYHVLSKLEAHELDVIIDDGPHSLVQQFGCLFLFWPHLKPGGLYVVEDAIQMWEYAHLKGAMPLSVFGAVEILDRRHVKRREDDFLVIIRKGQA